MVQVTTRERVDAYWSSTLGVDIAELHSPGVRVLPHPDAQADWRGVYVLTFDTAASVFVPKAMLDDVAQGLEPADPQAILEPAFWRSLLGATVRAAFGPVVHHYLDDADGLGEHAGGRRINPRDADTLAELRGTIAPDEWRSAGFNAQPAMMFGLFEGERMVAAANLTSGPDAATDVGIVIEPTQRGKGHGTRIAATAAKQAIAMHGVARFRVFATSAPTLAIAAKLGFAEYGRNLAAYLQP